MSWNDTNFSEDPVDSVEEADPSPVDADISEQEAAPDVDSEAINDVDAPSDFVAAEITVVVTTNERDVDELLGELRMYAGNEVADALITVRAFLNENPSASCDAAYVDLVVSLSALAGSP